MSILGGFLAIQLLGALFPLDLSIDISGFKERVKSSNFGLLMKNNIRNNLDWQDALAQALWYVPPGILVILCRRREWNPDKRGVWYCGLVFAATFPFTAEILRLLESSGVFNIYRGAAGTTGMLVGIGFGLLVRERWSLSDALRITILIYLLNIVISEWLPFQVISKRDVIASKWAQFELFPFASYYEKTTLWSVKDFFATVLLTLPLGMCLRWKRDGGPGLTSLKVVAIGLSLGVVLELGQVYIQGRFPGVTDIMSLTAGVMIGSYLFRLHSEMASRLMPLESELLDHPRTLEAKEIKR